MENIRRVTQYDHLKILADSRRLYILQRLMAGPATLSMLGKELGEHPARVRHHLKKLEEIDLVELVDTQVVRGFVEKYYRAKARAFILNDLILPADIPPDHQTLFIMGSHDLALEALLQHVQQHISNQLSKYSHRQPGWPGSTAPGNRPLEWCPSMGRRTR